MKNNKSKRIAIFEGSKIRRHWDEEKELWYFSIADIVRVLTGSVDAGAYWRKLKQRLKEEGSEVVTKCHGLKFVANDGKYYLTDEWKIWGVKEGLEFSILGKIYS